MEVLIDHRRVIQVKHIKLDTLDEAVYSQQTSLG